MTSPRRLLVVLTALVLAGAPAVATVATAAPPTAPVPSALATGAAADVHLTSASRVDHPAHGPSAAPAVTHPRGTRRLPTTLAAPAATARASATVAATGSARPLRTSFNGVSSLDSALTNFNAEFEPPDQGLCTGNGFVLEAVNSAYRIYRTDGTTVRGPFNVNDLFDEGAAEFTSDPRCFYEPGTHTWYAVVLFIDFTTGVTRVDLAVNTSGDPTSLWTQYRIDTTDDGRLGEPSNPGCPCLGDQPLFGIDQDNVYVSTNEFSLNGPEFNGAQVYAVAKKDLQAGRPRAHVVHLGGLSAGGAVAASVQPASNLTVAPAEFFLSSLDPHGTFDARIAVWALTGGARVASGGVPRLTQVVVSSQPYGVPPSASQKGSTTPLDGGDDRMQQTQYIGGRVWGALATGVSVPGDPSARSGAAWFSVEPRLSAGRIASARIDRQGTLAVAGRSLLYPAIQADESGRAAMAFTLTGDDRFPSAAYATLSATGSAVSAPAVAGAGTGPYSRHSHRWGDYSYATYDPVGHQIWMATEYVPPATSQTPDGRQNWGTRVFSVSAR